jgi:hypothetical protein
LEALRAADAARDAAFDALRAAILFAVLLRFPKLRLDAICIYILIIKKYFLNFDN